MEFQNEPFQELKARVERCEMDIAKVTLILGKTTDCLERLANGAEKPETVREEPDDERGEPFLSPVDKVQKTDE